MIDMLWRLKGGNFAIQFQYSVWNLKIVTNFLSSKSVLLDLVVEFFEVLPVNRKKNAKHASGIGVSFIWKSENTSSLRF